MRSKVLAPLKKGKMGDSFFILVNIKSKWVFYVFSFLFLSFGLMDNDPFAKIRSCFIWKYVTLSKKNGLRKLVCVYAKGNIRLQLVFAI